MTHTHHRYANGLNKLFLFLKHKTIILKVFNEVFNFIKQQRYFSLYFPFYECNIFSLLFVVCFSFLFVFSWILSHLNNLFIFCCSLFGNELFCFRNLSSLEITICAHMFRMKKEEKFCDISFSPEYY